MDTETIERFEPFIWDDRFHTGVSTVDEQHHKLIDLVNRLGAIATHHASTEELGAILKELAEYTVYHFTTEQELMKQYQIDAAHQQAHVSAHKHFTEQVTTAARILMAGTNVSGQPIAPLLKYLTNWLVQHILGSDQRMGQEIIALQNGETHEAAVAKANAHMSQAANVLMQALNDMYGKLGDKTLEVMQKNQELLQLNQELEQRVRRRTAALEQANQQLKTSNAELKQLNEKLESTQSQLLQSEKLASIGQLAAGVAHEINNPVGFVNSNLGTLGKYVNGIFKVLDAYGNAESKGGDTQFADVAAVKKQVDYSYLAEDIPSLLKESQDGLSRVTRIVQDLKDFSHVDESNWQISNLERGIDSTLNVVANEIKYKADVIKEYTGLPDIQCMPSQLNQVFMNLLVNAAQAIEQHGTITVRTGTEDDNVWVEIADTGKGIPPENLKRIFDPFFTTKPVGKGTGLGLSLAYGIVQKHHGRFEVSSEPGKGTKFRIHLPQRQEEAE